MPGLQVDLALPLAEVRLHVVVGDHVLAPGERLEVLLGSRQHRPAAIGDRGRAVGYHPDVLTVVTPAAQFVGDATGVVPALPAVPADALDRVAQRTR